MTGLWGLRLAAIGRECEVGNVGCGAFYSRNLGLADWQVCGKLTGRNGSRRARHAVEFIAGKLPVKFRCQEAAGRHRVFPTLSGRWYRGRLKVSFHQQPVDYG